MKVFPDRLKYVFVKFPLLESVLSKLDEASINYLIGGSVALYLQGNEREPRDVDLMFLVEEHDKANILFNIEVAEIKRLSVSMRKSTPVSDGSIDFLSKYTAIAENKKYHAPPTEAVQVVTYNKAYQLVPAEKIVVFKLIGRRLHHHDLADVKALLDRSDFDRQLFERIVDQLNAKEVVRLIAAENKL